MEKVDNMQEQMSNENREMKTVKRVEVKNSNRNEEHFLLVGLTQLMKKINELDDKSPKLKHNEEKRMGERRNQTPKKCGTV